MNSTTSSQGMACIPKVEGLQSEIAAETRHLPPNIGGPELAASARFLSLFAGAGNRRLSGTDTPATVLPAMSEAGNQFSFNAADTNDAVERGQRFPIGGAFVTKSDKEG
jgi:hypothetical protein